MPICVRPWECVRTCTYIRTGALWSADLRPAGAPGLLTPTCSHRAQSMDAGCGHGTSAWNYGAFEKWKRVCYTPRMRDVNQNSIQFICFIWRIARRPDWRLAAVLTGHPGLVTRNSTQPAYSTTRHVHVQICSRSQFSIVMLFSFIKGMARYKKSVCMYNKWC